MGIKYKCSYNGCLSLLIDRGYCEQHSHIPQEMEAKNKARMFANAKKHKELYNTTEWRNLRQTILNYHPYCSKCNGDLSLSVHHVQPHRGNPELFYMPSNLIVMCDKCHKALHSGTYGR